MSKRLLSLLMTLALCFSMLPSAALAETADAAAEKTQNVENDADVYTVGEDTVLQSGEEGGVAVQASGHNHKVGSKSAAFTAWTESDSLPSVPGYYYLTGPVELDEVYTPPRSDGSTEGVVLCLNGYDITSSGSEAIVVYKDRTFTLCDCKDTGKITRSQDDTADYTGGGVTVNGTFNMYGGNITGHKLYNNAGVSLENANAVFNMYGGTVSGNKTTKKSGINGEGAGVAVNSGTFNMYDGTITGNTADLNGAGVYVYPDGTFTMYNGTISGNTAKSNSGGVFVSKSNTSVGTFIMTGGSIIGNNVENTTSGLGGGVLVNTDAIMKISGDIEIQNNRKGGTLNEATGLYEQGIADNLCLAGSSDGQTPVTVIGALTGSMPVGISKPVNRMPATGKPVKIAVGEGYTLKGADIDCFTPDAGSGYRLIYNNDVGALYLELKPHEHPICGENCTHNGTHGNEVWTAISTASELTTAEYKGGFYYLTADIAQGSGWSAWTPIKDVVLCLNGHSITHNGDKNVINVKKNVTFTLCDCNGSESTRKFTVDKSGLIAEGGVAARGEINDPDGVLTGTVAVSGTTLKFSFADDASKAGKTATVVVKVTDATNYDDYIITVTLTVENKLTPILEGDVTLAPAEITYGEPLNTIGISGTMKVGDTTVEGKFAWQNPNEVPEAGTHWVNWKFTPIDKKTYTEAIGSVQITVKKAKQSAKLNMTGYTYGEMPVKPELTERNTDTEAIYYYSSSGSGTDNIWDIYNPPKLNAGTYTMYAVISGTNNYDSFSTDPVEFTVAKATPDYKKPSGLTAKYGQTLGDIALTNPEGTTPGTWSWQTPQTVLDKIGSYTYDADFKPDDPSYKGVVGAAITVTVGKADGNNLKIEELSQKYTYTTEYTYTPDWTGLPAGQTWSYNSEYSVSAGSTAKLTTHDFKADGSLLTYAVSGGKAGDIVTVTLKASCSNYEDFTVTLNITLADRDAQAALHVTGDNTVVYGQTLTLGSDGGSGTGEVTYAVTNGTGEAAIDPKTGILTPVKVGTVTVTAAKAGDNDFKEAVSAPFEITITQAASEGEPNYTKITRSGKTLNDAALTTEGSTLNPNAGKLEWLDDEGNVLPNDTKVEANKTYKWRFTPDDGNYAVLTGEIELYHVSSGGGVGNTITASYTVTFDTDGGSKLSNQAVAKNSAVKEPAAPTKEGYDFAGWYTDKELTAKYDFSAKVTGSMTLYAAWTKKDNSLNQIILTIGEKDALVFGVVKTNDVAPQIVNDRTMLPARFVAENLGAKVSWDGEKELVTIKGRNSKTSEDITILIYIGSDIAYVNGREFKLDSAAFVENDRTYTPVRFISEELGASVEWIESEQKVVITK